MKHTPGPWYIEEHNYEVYLSIITNRKTPYDADGFTIAETYGRLETREANARLIAAAPELLDVLKSLVRSIKSSDSYMVSLYISDAEIAIKKSEGDIN